MTPLQFNCHRPGENSGSIFAAISAAPSAAAISRPESIGPAILRSLRWRVPPCHEEQKRFGIPARVSRPLRREFAAFPPWRILDEAVEKLEPEFRIVFVLRD